MSVVYTPATRRYAINVGRATYDEEGEETGIKWHLSDSTSDLEKAKEIADSKTRLNDYVEVVDRTLQTNYLGERR